MSNIPENMFVIGNKLMTQCKVCGKIVRVDKPIIGSLHSCLTDGEVTYLRNNPSILKEFRKIQGL